MKFITVTDEADVSRQIRTKNIETIEGGSDNRAKITLVNGSTYIIVKEKVSLWQMITDINFLEINFEPSAARWTMVNIEFIQVIEQLTSASITTHFSTALSMRSGRIVLSDKSVADVEKEIIALSRKD